jgi:predicted metal-dependent peptidase
MLAADPLQPFYRNSIQLLLDAPFFGQLLLGLHKSAPPQQEDIALYWTDQQQLGLLVGADLPVTASVQADILHELYHVIFKHPILYNQVYHPEVFSVAAELVVEQYSAITPAWVSSFLKELKLPPNADTMTYFQLLVEQRSVLSDILPPDIKREIKKHQLWRSNVDTELATMLLNSRIQQTIQQTPPDQWGQLPGSLQTYFQQAFSNTAPTISWQRYLRLFAARSRRTFLKNTIRRPSRRYGTSPGTMLNKRHRIVVAVDTSGSILDRHFDRFFREIHHIWKTGAQVHVVLCDTQIQEQWGYEGQPPGQVRGRGGTSFDAPIIFANQEWPADALIYLTDGQGPAPHVKPKMPMLWLIEGEEAPHLPGQKIYF